MASLKQALYVREQYPDAKFIFFTSTSDPPASATKNSTRRSRTTKNYFRQRQSCRGGSCCHGAVTLTAENAVTGEKSRQTVEMAVLATGMQPTAAGAKLPGDIKYTEDGFILNDFRKGGMFAAGCANKPADVVSSNQNATGMALKAIQTLAAK
jgi:quinone-modifying oxidoreductase subunit QmoA